MTNLGFHRLMEEHGIRVVTTDVGDRYVLEALRREGGLLGGEQSGHIIWLDGHVTGDGLVAALLLCAALEGRTLAEAVGGDGADARRPRRTSRFATKEIPAELRGRDRSDRGADTTAGCSSVRPAPNRSSGCSRRRKPLKGGGSLC